MKDIKQSRSKSTDTHQKTCNKCKSRLLESLWSKDVTRFCRTAALFIHSCANLWSNYVSPQSDTVPDVSLFLDQFNVSSLLYRLQEWSRFTHSFRCYFSALRLSTLTEMKGQEVCVKKPHVCSNSAVFTEQIDSEREAGHRSSAYISTRSADHRHVLPAARKQPRKRRSGLSCEFTDSKQLDALTIQHDYKNSPYTTPRALQPGFSEWRSERHNVNWPIGTATKRGSDHSEWKHAAPSSAAQRQEERPFCVHVPRDFNDHRRKIQTNAGKSSGRLRFFYKSPLQSHICRSHLEQVGELFSGGLNQLKIVWIMN